MNIFLKELEDVQQELQEEDFELVEDEGLYFDVESNDSENDDDILDDNTSIASAKRPGLRFVYLSRFFKLD